MYWNTRQLTKRPQPVPVLALQQRVQLNVPVAFVGHFEVGSKLFRLLRHVAEQELTNGLVQRQACVLAAVTILLLQRLLER